MLFVAVRQVTEYIFQRFHCLDRHADRCWELGTVHMCMGNLQECDTWAGQMVQQLLLLTPALFDFWKQYKRSLAWSVSFSFEM